VPRVIEYVQSNTGKLPRLLAFLREVSDIWPYDDKEFLEDYPICFSTDLEFIEQQLRVFADVHRQIVLGNPHMMQAVKFPDVLQETFPLHHAFYATLGPLRAFLEKLEELLHYIKQFPIALSDFVRRQTFLNSTRWGRRLRHAGIDPHIDLWSLP
jgi:hypothetical protein